MLLLAVMFSAQESSARTVYEEESFAISHQHWDSQPQRLAVRISCQQSTFRRDPKSN